MHKMKFKIESQPFKLPISTTTLLLTTRFSAIPFLILCIKWLVWLSLNCVIISGISGLNMDFWIAVWSSDHNFYLNILNNFYYNLHIIRILYLLLLIKVSDLLQNNWKVWHNVILFDIIFKREEYHRKCFIYARTLYKSDITFGDEV